MSFFAGSVAKNWVTASTIGTVVAALIPLSACLLTTDLSNVVGTRPVDAGDDGFDSLDSSTDAGAADAGFSCTGHALCTQFDNGALQSDGWKLQIMGSGQATLDGTEFTSPPAAFRSVLPVNTTTDHWDAIIFQTVLVPAYTTLTYAFDLRITECVSKGPAITLAAINPLTNYAIGLLINASGMQFSETVTNADGGLTSTAAILQAQPPTGAWQRVTVVIANPTNPIVDVYLGTKDVLPAHPITPFTPGGGVLLNLGANGVGPTQECDVAYDNVTFDRQ